MDKQQIISFIEGQLANGKITKEDLATMARGVLVAQPQFSSPVVEMAPVKEENSRSLSHVFYGIGAIIALVGVSILVFQNWDEIGFAGRILVTLGISLLTYIFGMVAGKPEQKALSQVMFVIAAALAPLGSFVLLNEAGIYYLSWFNHFLIAVILFLIFGVALLVSKRNVLVLVTVGFASWAYYALLMNMGFEYYESDFMKLATMLLGASYLCIGYSFHSYWHAADLQDEKEKKAVQNVLYGFGTLAVLGAGIFIGGVFDLVLVALIFAAFYGSVYLKSRSMLTLGALFLMAHIVKLTSEYFVYSIGWPVALIVVGFLVIGVGYGTFYLNKKYISA